MTIQTGKALSKSNKQSMFGNFKISRLYRFFLGIYIISCLCHKGLLRA